MGINSVFHCGSGVAEGTDYLVSLFDHNGTLRAVAPQVVFGDLDSFQAVVRSMTCKQRYTSGVLTFTERNLTPKQKRQIIDEHLRITAPGLDPSRLAACYVEHQDKRATELHYVIANIDLGTGKRLNAYYHRSDRLRLRTWMQSLNDRFSLSDPNDPARWRLYAPGKKEVSESRKTMQSKLLLAIEKQALAGVVKCRADIENALTRAGWIISRRTKTFISITHPSIKVPVRLTGKMFAADWQGAMPADAVERLAQEWVASKAARLRQTAADLAAMIRARANYNHKRYCGDYSGDEPLIDEITIQAETMAAEIERARPQDRMAALRADIAALRAQLGGAPSLESAADFARARVQRAQAAAPALQPRNTPRPRAPRL